MAVSTSYLASIPPPKRVERPHYEVTVSNEMHQLICCTPYTEITNYQCILPGIDVASRYKVARPLKTKQAKDVAEMIASIYKVGPLTDSKIFQCDNGSKFKGEVTRLWKRMKLRLGE